MAGDDAEIRELRPGQEGKVPRIHDRRAGANSIQAQLIREDEEQNRKTVGRIAEVEARRTLSVLEQAAVVAERGSGYGRRPHLLRTKSLSWRSALSCVVW